MEMRRSVQSSPGLLVADTRQLNELSELITLGNCNFPDPGHC